MPGSRGNTLSQRMRTMPILVDFYVMQKAKGLKVQLYDADADGDIDQDDFDVIVGRKVAGVTAELGTPEAQAQFKLIEAKASKAKLYRGKSLNWGAGGRSLLLQDRLLCEGKTLPEAKEIVKINYFNQLRYRT
jgi:hypothetical protein